MDLLLKHLMDSQVDESELKEQVIPQLMQKGFKKVADLEVLEKDDLKGFSDVTKRRLWRFVQRSEYRITSSSADAAIQEVDAEQESIYIRYIFCGSDYFAADHSEQHIKDINPTKMKLIDVVNMICNMNNLPSEQTIELYSSQGYPLQSSTIVAEKAALNSWGVYDGDLFYAVPRLKRQPGIKEFVSLPELDHNIGQETFHIETPFLDSFEVNAYKDCDSPEDIAQKVYSVTELPVPFMSLFVRRGYIHERMTAFTELQDNDHIRVVLRNPSEIVQPHSFNYGHQSYNFLVPQTESGMTKFFSILKFICSPNPVNKKYNFEQFLSHLMTFTKFPPMVYAMRNLKEFSFLTISGWTALIEGLYLLFKTIIDTFATVSEKCIFEYSDYIMSILISKSHQVKDTSNVETEYCSLICPLSGTKIHNPVRVDIDIKQGPFDKDNIIAKVESTDAGDNDSKVKVKKEQLKADPEVAKLLMYFPWETDNKVCVWMNPQKDVIPKVCKKLDVSFQWFEMLDSLSELYIVNPQGLYSGDECLTYNSEGCLIYFLGSTKSTDENRRFYNACASAESDYQQVIKKSKLEEIGSSSLELQVTADIVKVLKKHSEEIHINCEDERKLAIISSKESIKWDIEEAIVVLFDQSGSMSSQVFPEMKMRRIDAAKQLFNSFSTRTQAYKLHHALGLTLISSEVTVKLELTKNIEKFETCLKDINVTGMTELTAAVVNAVRQLQKFNCRRRILCLTDGYNSSSTTYDTALHFAKDANVVVDTVLLTFPDDNKEQKAFSHATGGVCVLPKTMQEALRYFELDAMLSLKERVPNHKILSTVLSDFFDMKCYPYETETSFKSTYIEDFENVRTQSIKSHIDQLKGQAINNAQQRRIIKELRDIMSNPHERIKVYPSQTNYQKWKVLLRAPEMTAYSGGIFALSVEFHTKYPVMPPEIRFLTPIYHCNISGSSGRICHAILGEAYTPSTSMREILCYIYGLLICPDMDTPLDSALAGEYEYQSGRDKKDTDEFLQAASGYFKKAASDVHLHASTQFDILDKKFSG